MYHLCSGSYKFISWTNKWSCTIEESGSCTIEESGFGMYSYCLSSSTRAVLLLSARDELVYELAGVEEASKH
jgi:hypothetical protein|uniref:Uncharacterized protein n=1 Tax=Picea glauca TaxID=3330 RepID=A0A101M0N8_PICGL|nr:hypothetical protein ABT39_MTgene4160 [Picea glauca]QHR89015.1 hypothetical protein Q903MT_gene3034 [Picea sitchensis]